MSSAGPYFFALSFFLQAVGSPCPVSARVLQAASAEAPAPLPPLPPAGEMARLKVLIEAGELETARARLEPIVGEHPGWARATLLLALVEFRENRFERARALFERAAALDPDEPSGGLYLGWCLFYLGELDLAEASIGKFLERLPDHPEAHLALGRIALETDDVEKVRRELENAVQLATNARDPLVEGRARAALAELGLRLDDLDGARREVERAAILLPDSAEIQFQLSRVLERAGDAAGAARARAKSEALRAIAESAPLEEKPE